VQATLAELPGNLRTEVLMHLQADVVQRASLFKHCDPGFIKSVVVRLKPQARWPFAGPAAAAATNNGGLLVMSTVCWSARWCQK